ncbi:hypothetical protein ACVSQB_32975 [Bradyrhizobium elkanii]
MATDHLPPSLFDQFGLLSHDVLNALSEDDLARMTDEEKICLANLVESDAAVAAAEQRVIDTRKKMAELSVAHTATNDALIAARGPVDPVALIKQVIAIHNGVTQHEPSIAELTKAHSDLQATGRTLKSKADKSGNEADVATLETFMTEKLIPAREKLEKAQKVEAATVAHEATEAALASARAEYHQATAALTPIRAHHGEVLTAWSRLGRRLNQLDLARAAAERTNAERLAAAKANPPSTDPRELPIAKAFAAKKDVARSTRRSYAPPPPVRGSLIPQPQAPRPASGQRTRS